MTKSELINEILSEWAYRVDDGMPNPNNENHLAELSMILSEMGLSEIKNELFENLKEADSKQFSNPILNKVIKYKNEKGEDKEGAVGNLLRLAKGTAGRDAAEKVIPADGTPERDAMNKSLGSEKDGKSTEPAGEEKPKDSEKPAGGGGEEEKAQAAQSMFDPKADPAMGARLDREKEANAKIVQKDKEDAQSEKDVKDDEKKDDKFNPIAAVDVQKEMPQADPETFGGTTDIPDKIQPEELQQFNTDINKVSQIVAKAKENNQKIPDINLCDLTVPGTNLYCDDNLGIKRKAMPQFKGKPVPGSRAEKMPLNDDGEVDTEPVFKEMLKEKGIKTSQTEVPADKLKATQSELGGDKVVGMMHTLEKNPEHPSLTAPIYVSRDGFVIDGHHRWAAIVAYNAQHPDNQIPMKCTVIDMDIKDAIPMCNDFAEGMGIASKKQGETTGKAGQEQPKPATSIPDGKLNTTAKSAVNRIKDGIKKWAGEQKEFFTKKVHKGNSPERRSFGEAFMHKAKGTWEAIKHGAQHEVELFKSASSGVKNFFSGGEVSETEKKALIGVAKKVVVASVFGAVGGGLAHGALAFGKHVMMEFIPHLVAETIGTGAGKAALFAGEEDDDAEMMRFMEIISKKLQSEEIPDEIMADAVESYNENNQPQMTEENIDLANELMLEMIYGFIEEATGDPKLAARSKETGKVVYFKTKQAKDNAIKSGTHEDPKAKKVGTDKKQAATQNMFTSDPSYQKKLGKEKPAAVSTPTGKVEPTPTTTKPAKGARIIGGKDKTLAKVDTLKTKEFTQKQQPDDAKFAEKNKKYQIGPPPAPYKIPKELYANSKVPPRHLKALERMMNTKATNETAKWSHFSDLPGGAGQISAQAGELMTMISTTLDDKQAAAFFNSLLEHEKLQIQSNPNLKSEGSRVVGNSWIKAAVNNRRAIRNRLSKEYPGATIEAGSWDTAGEVEAMGLSDYKKNKGFSTDAYFKIKTKDGKEILDEVSLKKSTAVNFLNSGTGKLFEWDPNIPDDINPNVYQKNQRKALAEFGGANLKKLQAIVAKDPEFQAIVKSKKISLEDAISKLQAGKGSRDINKVVLSAITVAAKKGDKGALKYLQNVQDTHKAHQRAVISALGTNPKLKQGMLGAIREEFPLKAVGEGEESMAIGPNSLDRAVLKDIFQTSDFEEIKQGLFAVTDEEPPYLAYKAGKKGRVIPIATIVAREDGVGYGGQIKFEMQLDKRFAKILEQANKNIYGG